MTEKRLPRRIIITGAGGVGKTSLAEGLAARLCLPVIAEVGRALCQTLGYARIGEVPDQEGFKRKVLEAQIEEEERLDSFIADRSTLDCWVLWQRWNICSAMSYDTESYYNIARQQSSKYTQIIYVPTMFAPADDGFRWTDRDYQDQIDRLVRMTIYEWGLWDRTVTIKSKALPERIEEVLDWWNRSGFA